MKKNDPFKSTKLSSEVLQEAFQSDQVITTMSGGAVKSTRDCDNFVYY